MKKLCSLFMSVAMLLVYGCGLIQIYAEEIETIDGLQTTVTDSEDDAVSQGTVEDILSFSCIYDAKTNKINISGTMKHDAFASHRNSTLAIYQIPPGKSENDVINDKNSVPLTETGISVSFGFTFNAQTIADRYSRYAVFLRTPEGELILGTLAQYAEVASTYKPLASKDNFKGILSETAATAGGIDAGTVIIPVYLEGMITYNSNGYMYTDASGQRFFDRAYIDGLDSQVNSAAIAGARVYLQFLYRNTVTEGEKLSEYLLPDIYTEDELSYIHAVTDFIVNRYNGVAASGISGIVIGSTLNCYGAYNYSEQSEFEGYASQCGFYASVISNIARSVNSDIDIVLPFSDYGFNETEEVEKEGVFQADELIDYLLQYFDDCFASGLSCSFLVELENAPFGITNQNIKDGVNLDYDYTGEGFYIGNHDVLSQYFSSRENKYKSLPADIMVQWTPDDSLSGNALDAAYSYSYYALLDDRYVSSFIIKETPSNNVKDILFTIEHIDTSKTSEITKHLLPYFGVDLWEKLDGISTVLTDNIKNIYRVQPNFELPENYKGSFSYFDFSEMILANRWYRGIGCSAIKIDYARSDKKALKATMTGNKSVANELLYDYELHENMAYTPYLKFDFEIENKLESSNNTSVALYQVKVICENEKERFVSTCFVNSNEYTEFLVDLSQYSSFGNVESVRISVCAMDGSQQDFNLWLYEISGYSTEYSSSELENLILFDRDKMNTEAGETGGLTVERIILIAIIVTVASVLGIGTLIILRRSHHLEE